MARSNPPAGFWALLWLGGTALVIWLPLLLLEHVARSPAPSRRTPSPPDPRRAVRPLPKLARASASATGASPSLPAAGPPAFLPLPGYAAHRTALYPRQASAFSLTLLPSDQPLQLSDYLTPGRSLPGRALLGGPLGLESINEKAMVPAARTERALRAMASDPLQALPRHWRNELRSLVRSARTVLPAEVVRIPAPHRRTPEEIPLALRASGRGDTTVAPSSSSSFQKIERWALRQSALPDGTIWPVLVVLEPIELRPLPAAPLPSVDVPAPPASHDQSQASEPSPLAFRLSSRAGDSASISVPIHSEDPAQAAVEPPAPPSPPPVAAAPPDTANVSISPPITSEDILP